MARFELKERSVLQRLAMPNGDLHTFSSSAVRISERRGLSLATVIARKGKLAELTQALERTFGVKLPSPGHRTGTAALAFAWSAPGQWLASTEHVDRATFENQLRNGLSSLASISNQSDGRTIISIAGPAAREVLAKGVPIDLHPSAFGVGRTASTTVAHITTHFWQIDEAPTFEFVVFRSFAPAFWNFLTESAAEYGSGGNSH